MFALNYAAAAEGFIVASEVELGCNEFNRNGRNGGLIRRRSKATTAVEGAANLSVGDLWAEDIHVSCKWLILLEQKL